MRTLLERLVMVMTLVLLVASFGQTQSAAVLVAGLAALAIATVLVARRSGAVALRVQVGLRAREHRQLLAAQPAPSHPNTAGRTRSRAPGAVVSAV
jgi:hypothetical protein